MSSIRSFGTPLFALAALVLAANGARAEGAGPIDTLQPSYNASGVGTTVLPVFQGGTLLIDSDFIILPQSFALDASPTNTIDQAGRTAFFTGVTFDAALGTPGSITIANSGVGGQIILTNANTYTGTTTINAGATLALDTNGSIATSSNVIANGRFDVSGAAFSQTGEASIVTLSGTGSVTLGLPGETTANLAITNGSTTFSGVISGAGNLRIAGGTQVLSGDNTYVGVTIINSGATLQLGAGGTSGSVATDVFNGGTLVFNRSDSYTFGNVISGSGAVTQNGPGTLILTGTNLYTGMTTIAGGTLQLGNGGTTGSIVGDITNNAALVFNRSDNISFGGIISGTGTLNQSGPGSLTLTNVNPYTGTTTISTGATLALTGNASIASSSNVIADGTFDISGAGFGASIITLSGKGAVALGSQTLTLTNASTTFAGVIAGKGGLAVTGGLMTLSGDNTYVGGTTITGAILRLGAGDTSGSIVGDVTNNGALVFNRSDTVTFGGAITGNGLVQQSGPGVTVLTGSNTYSGGTFINAGALQIGNGGTSGSIVGDVSNNGTLAFNRSDSITFGGAITGSGSLTQMGTGTTILTGTNTYSGGTTISAGTLQIGNGGTSGSIAGDVTNNGTLAFNRSDNLLFAGVVSGSGSLVQNGTGILALTDTNTYTGGTTINAGTLQIGNGGTTGSVAGNIANFATLVFNRTNAITYGGVISGTGNLFQTGGGTLTLTGNNTYVGVTTINAGSTLALTGTGSIAFSSQVNANGTFDISGTTAGAGITTLGGSGSVILGNQNLTLGRVSGQFFSGVISGTGGLSITSGTFGSLVLTGANTYTGGTTIDVATFLTIGNFGTTGSIVGDVVNNGRLEFTRSNAYTFAGNISGVGELIQDGAGTTILTGTNTYSGGTFISSGTLQIGNGGTSGSVAGDISDNSLLVYNRSDTVTNNNVISGEGALTQAGPGKLILNGVNTYIGLTTVSAGFLMVGDAAHPTGQVAGAVTVNSGALLQGHGIILGAVTNSGTVAPGGSIGTLTVGSYTQAPGGTFAVEIDPTAASKLVSAGAATVNGAAAVAFDPGTYRTRLYQILTGAPVTGRFTSLAITSLPTDFVAGLYYNPNGTEIDLVAANTRTTTIYSNINTQMVNNGQAFGASLLRMLGTPNPCATGGTLAGNVASTAANQQACSERSRAWMTPYGSLAEYGRSDRGGFSSTSGGIAGGVDRTFDQGITVGLAGQYAVDRLSATGSASTARLTSYGIGAYGRVPVGNLKFDGAAYYVTNTSVVQRDSLGAGLAHASPGGHGAGGALQVSYDLMGGDVAPFAQIRAFNYSRQGATETGLGPMGFAINSANLTSVRADLGVRLQHTYQVGSIRLTPQVWIGIEQEFGSTRNATTGSLASVLGTNFSVSPKAIDRTLGAVDIRLAAAITDTAQIYLDLGGRVGNSTKQGTAIFGGQLRF